VIWAFFHWSMLVMRVLGSLPLPWAKRLSSLLNPSFTLPLRRNRRRNIALLFPGHDAREFRRFERDYLRYLARMRADLAWLAYGGTPEGIRRSVTLDGREHLDAALARGRGVLIVEAHLGNWNFTPGVLGLLGYPVSVVTNPTVGDNLDLRGFHERLARKCGVRLGFVGQSAYEVARDTFRRNGVFYLSLDVAIGTRRLQWFSLGPAGFQVDAGPAVFSRRHEVPVLFAESVVTDSGTSLTLHPQPAVEDESHRAAAPALPASWLETMRRVILEHPTQWWSLSFVGLARHPAGST
jgi:KDO2-lipid IV(A) lauroyltransferase